MGQVFRGFSSSGDTVAVKKVPVTGGAVGRPRGVNREIAIGNLINKIDSEYVVKTLDWAEGENEILIVMPMADRSLAQAIASNELEEVSKIEIVRHVSLGLVGLAEASVIYRDLKPANILDFGGVWKLADFGIARDLNEVTGTLTYKRYGTPAYMAPELWNGGLHSVKSDLYALGILAWEMFMGVLPHLGPKDEDYARQHQSDDPTDIASSSAGLKILIRRLLAKEPHSRPQDARTVVDELESLDRPLPPELERLRNAVADHQERRNLAETSVALATAKEAARLEVLSQGRTDLLHILERARDGIRLVIPDVSLAPIQDGLRLSGDSGLLQISYWHFQPVPPLEENDPLLMAAAVYKNLSDPFPIADLVYELIQDRYVWSVLRFTSSGMVGNNYSLGPIGLRHGLNYSDFWRERCFMVHRATHIWTMEKNKLDAGGVQLLFEEAVRNSIT
jgi:serine/threonine protein kinase